MKLFWKLIWLNHWRVYRKTWNLVKAVARRAGVKRKNIVHLEVLQYGLNVKIRVNDRIEFHPEPKDFQTYLTPIYSLYNIRFPDTRVSGKISGWSHLGHLGHLS